MKQPAIYIVTNKRNGTLYTGVTSNLVKRIYEHKNGVIAGFTHTYKCTMLVYFEIYETMESAITREKQLKAGSRKRKIDLIVTTNPGWRDLYDDLVR